MLDLIGRTGQVTQADIDEGIHGDCERCPIALALKRMIPEAEAISIEADGIDIHLPSDIAPILIQTTHKIRKWIYEFDRQAYVIPIRLKISKVDYGKYPMRLDIGA